MTTEPEPEPGPGPLVLDVADGRYAVCRLPASAAVPAWSDLASVAAEAPLVAVTRTGSELSLVVDERVVPDDVTAERGWRALAVRGPLEFQLTGILASLATTLAAADVSIFALSTHDTDWVLVQQDALGDAVAALRAAGHTVHRSP